MTETHKKSALTVTVLIVLAIALSGYVDSFGKRYTDENFSRALLTFGVARGLNAVISVAQGTEVAMEPAGVGVVFAPGQVLDPVNDLIERFSWIMLASTTSIGIQSLLLKALATDGVAVLISIVTAMSLTMLWWPRPLPATPRRLGNRLLLLLLVIRFAVPVMAVANEGFYKLFLEPEYRASSDQLAATRDRIGSLNMQRSHADDGDTGQSNWYDSLRHNVDSMLDTMNVDRQVSSLQAAVTSLTEHTINLIVVFTVQTILFPLAFLWLVARLFRFLSR